MEGMITKCAQALTPTAAKGIAGKELLSSYSLERQPIGAAVVHR